MAKEWIGGEISRNIQVTSGAETRGVVLNAWLESNATTTPTSFNSFKLNDNILTINGNKYSLDGVASITDTIESSFKDIECIDNENGTITLYVGNNYIVVNEYIENSN